MEKQLQDILDKYPNYKEYLWYKAHEEELLRRYYSRYLVIKDEKVIADYGSKGLAWDMTVKHHKPGTFIIHHCVPENEQKKIHLANHELVTVKHG